MVLCFFLEALFLVAMFVEMHMKARIGVVSPTALGMVLFLLAGVHAAYNLTSDSK